MNSHELEILIFLYNANDPLPLSGRYYDPFRIEELKTQELVKGANLGTGKYWAEITDKGKALVDEVLCWANVKLDLNPEEPTDRRTREQKFFDKMGTSPGFTIETQGKKLGEIRSMKKKHILKKDLPGASRRRN